MKLVVLFVTVMLLSCFQPIAAQGGKVLRMCQRKFSRCSSSTKYSRNFKAGAKCCGRAWTVRSLNVPREGIVYKKFLRVPVCRETGLLLSVSEIHLLSKYFFYSNLLLLKHDRVYAETQRILWF